MRLAFSLLVCQTFPGCVSDSVSLAAAGFFARALALPRLGSAEAACCAFGCCFGLLAVLWSPLIWLYPSLSDGLSDNASVELIVWVCIWLFGPVFLAKVYCEAGWT